MLDIMPIAANQWLRPQPLQDDGAYNLRSSVTTSKIFKVAGLSVLGFCVVSIGMNRANAGPMASQVAGFCGAFLGALAAQRRKRAESQAPKDEQPKTDETQNP